MNKERIKSVIKFFIGGQVPEGTIKLGTFHSFFWLKKYFIFNSCEQGFPRYLMSGGANTEYFQNLRGGVKNLSDLMDNFQKFGVGRYFFSKYILPAPYLHHPLGKPRLWVFLSSFVKDFENWDIPLKLKMISFYKHSIT